MSETLSFTTTEETVVSGVSNDSEKSGTQETNKIWDRDDLTPLIRANADVRVMWRGAETTLGHAISDYLISNSVTEETQDMVISLALELLVNPVIETEETVDEQESEDEENAKTEKAEKKNDNKFENDKAQQNPKPAELQKQAKSEVAEPKQPEPPTVTSQSKQSDVVAPKPAAVSRPAAIEPKPVQAAAKAEAAASSPISSADTLSQVSASEPESTIATNSAPESTASEPVIQETGQEAKGPTIPNEVQLGETSSTAGPVVESNQQSPALEIADSPALETRTPPDVSQQEAEQETDGFVIPPEIEVPNEPEPTESLFLDFDPAELTDENFELGEIDLLPATIDNQVPENEPAGFTEAEILIEHYEETDLEPDEQSVFSDAVALEVVDDSLGLVKDLSISEPSYEPQPLAEAETIGPEQIAQANLGIEEVKDTLVQLVELIDTGQPETTEIVYEILDNIIEAADKVEVDKGENIFTEAEARVEIEELFIELLGVMGIEPTPGLVESLANLTLEWHDSGTHEIIKELLMGLSTINKTTAHACAIGYIVLNPQLSLAA